MLPGSRTSELESGVLQLEPRDDTGNCPSLSGNRLSPHLSGVQTHVTVVHYLLLSAMALSAISH